MERWRKHATAVAVIMASAGLASPAVAVTVSDMRAVAPAGQPLSLEIELADLFDTPLKDITITPASADEHARLGMTRPSWLDQLQFQISQGDQGQVLARGSGPLLAPGQRVSFLVQIGWPGHLRLQQVSATVQDAASAASLAPMQPLVLPEPTVIPAAPQSAASVPAGAVAAPTPAEAGSTVIAAPAAKPVASAPARVPAMTGVTVPAAGGSLVVRQGDTLSTLAESWDADKLNLAQREQLIHARNPHAFIGGNINRLRAGARLSLPSLQADPLSSPAEARAWLGRAERGEAGGLSRPAAVTPSQLGDGDATAASGQDQEVTLTLVAPGRGDKGRAVGEAGAGAGGEDLKTRESLDAAETERSRLLAERRELAARLQDLTGRSADQDARLKVLDGRLAALDQQAKVNDQRQDVKQAMSEAAEAKPGTGVDTWVWALFAALILALLLLRLRSSSATADDEAEAVAPEAEPAPEPAVVLVDEAAGAVTLVPAAEMVASEPEPAMAPAGVAEAAWAAADSGDDEEYDFLSDSEAEAHQTRLDLAQAYIDMKEAEPARELLLMVQQGGTAEQRRLAGELLRSLA